MHALPLLRLLPFLPSASLRLLTMISALVCLPCQFAPPTPLQAP
jgi:hypothetical protein